MKLKLDENIAYSARKRLIAVGFDVDTVLEEGLRGHPDDEVWKSAQSEERFLVTQDLDFSDVRKFAPGTHHGILVVRLPDSDQWRLGDYLVGWLSAPDARSWARCFVVGSRNKVRVMRPAKDSNE